MTDWLLCAGVCVLLVVVGWRWAALLAETRMPFLVRACLAYLAGTALMTLGMLLVALIGLPVDRLTVVAAFAGVWAAGRGVAHAGHPAPPATVPGSGRLALPAALAAAAALGFGLVQVVRLGGVDSIDFVKAWGLKGTYVLVHHDLDFAGLAAPHRFYPLEVSNLNGAQYVLLGHVNDTVVRLPMALFGVSLAGCMWWLCRRFLPPAAAATAVALAVCTPEFTTSMTSGLADLTVAAYVTLAALAAYLWLLDGGRGYAGLSGFAAGAAAWTKLEGAPTCLAILVAVLIARRALRTPGVGVWLGWFAVFVIPWQVFQRIHGIPPTRSHFARVYLEFPWIIHHVTSTLSQTAHWGVFWPLVSALIAATAPFWWRTDHRLLAAVTLPNLALTLGAYVTHYRAGIEGSVEATAHRLYLHLAPSVAVMAIAGATVAFAELRANRPARVNPVPQD